VPLISGTALAGFQNPCDTVFSQAYSLRAENTLVKERDTAQNTRRRLAPVGLIFATFGILLFAYFVRKAGLGEIFAGIKRLGFAFLLILGISSIRQIVRSLAWTRCVEPPHRLRFRDALAARLMGDALGNIIPLASIAVAEPSKAAFVRDRVPLMTAVSSLALENIFYSLSVILFVFSGTVSLLLSFQLPKALRYASIVALVATAMVAAVGYLVIRSKVRFLSGAFRFLANRGSARNWFEKGIPRARTLEDQIYGFYDRNRGALLTTFALEMCFHLAGVLEIYTTLWFISPVAPTLLNAFILESVNRIINMTFKFVPLRLGVDEGGTGMVSAVLGLTKAVGVTLAIIRKGRDVFWATVGVALMVRRGLSLRSITEEASAGALKKELAAD
jgi:hypothetical protein